MPGGVKAAGAVLSATAPAKVPLGDALEESGVPPVRDAEGEMVAGEPPACVEDGVPEEVAVRAGFGMLERPCEQ